MPFDSVKFTFELKKVREACDEMEEIVASLQLYGMMNAAPAQAALNRLQLLMNAMASPPLGHMAELKSWAKNFSKGRTAQLGGGADVTTTYEHGRLWAGKAMQHKSTTADLKASVTTHIRDAANQLAGNRGETPPANFRRIIDVEVHSQVNTWPFPDTHPRGTYTKAQFHAQACSELEQQLSAATHVPHIPHAPTPGKGLTAAARGSLSDNTGPLAKPAATRSESVHQVGGAWQRTSAITVKLRFSFPYLLNGSAQRLSEVAYEVVQNTAAGPGATATQMKAHMVREKLV